MRRLLLHALLCVPLTLAGCQGQPDVGADVAAEAAPHGPHEKAAAPASAMPADAADAAADDPEGRYPEDRTPVMHSDFLAASENPLSTFSTDVDTAGYANVRRALEDGRLPPPQWVRIEEMVNYFAYDRPDASDRTLEVTADTARCPWDEGHLLARITLSAEEVAAEQRPACNLVLLVDVSGSMRSADKLPLLQGSLAKLAAQLRSDDTIAICTYAGGAGVVLEPTGGDERDAIVDAIYSLSAGGSTRGSAGIRLAYEMAFRNLMKDGINRVMLATDGDFNVGTTSTAQLVDMVAARAAEGVELTVLGFGISGRDDMLEAVTGSGDGAYASIDSPAEAEKVLVEGLTGTLVTVARDAKIQVEFDPARVSSYRLLGYDNRRLADADFRDDAKDAGEVGAGHQVTALYEIAPTDSFAAGPPMTVRWRYQSPDRDGSGFEHEQAVAAADVPFAAASADLRFATAVAAFGMTLRGDAPAGVTCDNIRSWATAALGADPKRRRSGFVDLVNRAKGIADRTGAAAPGE